MAYDQNVQYLSLAFWQIIMTAGPILAIALGIGLLIGLIQAATSIQGSVYKSHSKYGISSSKTSPFRPKENDEAKLHQNSL